MLVPENTRESTPDSEPTARGFPLIGRFPHLNEPDFSQSWQIGRIIPSLSIFVERFVIIENDYSLDKSMWKA
ncbi:hypothetical protein D4R75_03775 [bacterium]|nr:MAG: hypothetical protein D4R75_03775 [bacterium]